MSRQSGRVDTPPIEEYFKKAFLQQASVMSRQSGRADKPPKRSNSKNPPRAGKLDEQTIWASKQATNRGVIKQIPSAAGKLDEQTIWANRQTTNRGVIQTRFKVEPESQQIR